MLLLRLLLLLLPILLLSGALIQRPFTCTSGVNFHLAGLAGGLRSEAYISGHRCTVTLLLQLVGRQLLLLRLVLLLMEIVGSDHSTSSLKFLDHLGEQVLHGAEAGCGDAA